MTGANIPNLIHSVRGFESMSQIIVCHIHNNTVMGDEHILSLQSNMEFLPVQLPRIVLQRVEQIPAVREIMLSAMCVCVCAYKRIISFYSEDLYGRKNKMFSRNVMLPFIFCGLKLFLISVGLNVLCSFSSFSMIICSMLIMIGHVREIEYIYSKTCLKRNLNGPEHFSA